MTYKIFGCGSQVRILHFFKLEVQHLSKNVTPIVAQQQGQNA